MVSAVTSRPNHYEVLGLTPGASSDEIAQAFAKELSPLSPRPFGSLTEVTIAYETLRDPARRKAYDASIGLRHDPLKPPPKAPAEWAPFLVRPSIKPEDLPVIEALPPSMPPMRAQSLMKRLEPRPAPSATALLGQPVKTDAPKVNTPYQTEPEPRRPDAFEPVGPEPQAQGQRALHFFEAERGHEATNNAIQWKVLAVAAGALVLAVGVGAWTGWEAGNDVEQPAMAAVTLKVPRTASPTPPAELPADQALSTPKVPRERQTRADVAMARTERTPPTTQAVIAQLQTLEAAQVEETPSAEIATGQPAAESPSIEAAAVKAPLPNAVIARTIGRIGYPCGEVASTAAIEGAAPGVFKVTCTSGHSYRAAPVRGRYHFRRLGRP